MCWDYDEYPAVYNERTRRAKKRHRCVSGCWIEPGMEYSYATTLYDGRWYETKCCLPCKALSAALGKHCRLYEDWSQDAPLDDLRTAIEEEIRDGDFRLDDVKDKWQLHRRAVEFDKRVQAAGMDRLKEARAR